jgi:hypothetical protein
MIPYNFNKLGILVRAAIIQLLNAPVYQTVYRKIISSYQSNGGQTLYFHAGKSKVNDNFPNLGFEIESRKDEFVALSFTKEIEFNFSLYIAIKVLQGPVREGNEGPGDISETENYVITLSEFILEALNEPDFGLQYLITQDSDGNPITPPIKIYDSRAEGIQYGFLYNGALRIGKISWWGKILRTGPINNPGQTGY